MCDNALPILIENIEALRKLLGGSVRAVLDGEDVLDYGVSGSRT
jgi:hypothetical protein